MNAKDSEFKKVMSAHRHIAVIGVSADTSKPSYRIPMYMIQQGFAAVGVNPTQSHAPGIKMYSTLKEVPKEYLKFVNVFRRPDYIPEVIDEILNLGSTEVVWLQLGIAHTEAEARAEKAGLQVISNRCWLVEHKKYF